MRTPVHLAEVVLISIAASGSELALVRDLLHEYAASPDWEPGFAGYLADQKFDKEVRTLPGVYGPPRGVLLLAKRSGSPVGCIALKPYDFPEICEMKRLYVRPECRGMGVGHALVDRLMVEAKQRGYKRMRLDTLPSMGDAQRLYRSIGFSDIPPYCQNPIPGSAFLEKEL